jgi:hypothetical protein
MPASSPQGRGLCLGVRANLTEISNRTRTSEKRLFSYLEFFVAKEFSMTPTTYFSIQATPPRPISGNR